MYTISPIVIKINKIFVIFNKIINLLHLFLLHNKHIVIFIHPKQYPYIWY